MPKSIDLLETLTATDLVVIKDGLTVETDRLRKIAIGYSQDKDSQQFKDALDALYAKVNIENLIGDAIEARITEDLETASNTNKQDA
jgi:hypothetical protein